MILRIARDWVRCSDVITSEQRTQFYSDGFLVIEEVVPPRLWRNALEAINGSIGQGMAPEEMIRFRAQSFCPELRKAPVITALAYESRALDLANELVGDQLVPHGTGLTQIALRFPRFDADTDVLRPHLDGMHTPTNGVPEGEIFSFTILLGVVLSDVLEDNGGNFTVWPGSHRTLAERFAKVGPRSLIEGMPAIDLGEPLQVKAHIGNVVFAHYLLAHTVGPHHGPFIRYMTFQRLETATHAQHKWETMTDPWFEWPAMQGVVF